MEEDKQGYQIVFFDTETTGLGDEDRLCQIAYKVNGAEHEGLFKPPVPIQPMASEVTGITNEMVANKFPFVTSRMHEEISLLSKDQQTIFVAHNAQFDNEMLRREDIEIERYIDTLKIARALDTNNEADNYKQEYLWKFYDLQVDDAKAHDALGDVRVLEALYAKLGEIIINDSAKSDDVVMEMLEIMKNPLFIRIFPFGKYRGQKIEDLLETDPGYLEWLLSAKRRDAEEGRVDEDWIYTLSTVLGKEYTL